MYSMSRVFVAPAAPGLVKKRCMVQSVRMRSVTEDVTHLEASATSEASTSGQKPLEGERIAILRSTKVGRAAFQDLHPTRTIAAYFALPASQYSVLDAARIERVDETTFRCYVGSLSFFNFRVEPVLTVSVDVRDRGCDIRLLGCYLEGSPMAVAQNEKFRASMSNIIRWREASADSAEADDYDGHDSESSVSDDAARRDAKEVVSETTIQIDLVVPPWFVLPASVVEKTGSGVISATLAAMVPRFLKQLQRDYEKWAAGDDTRGPVPGAEGVEGDVFTDGSPL